MNSWRVPTGPADTATDDNADGALSYSSTSTDDIPLYSVVSVDSPNHMDISHHLPLVLMFLNKTSEASILPALQPEDILKMKDDQQVTTSSITQQQSNLDLKVSDLTENQINGQLQSTPAVLDNQAISQTTPTTSINQMAVFDKEDAAFQAQLAAFFNATIHMDEVISSTTLQSTSSTTTTTTTTTATTTRIPTRKAQGPKRPRPSKPSFGSTSSTITTTTPIPTTTSIAIKEEEEVVVVVSQMTTTTEPTISSTTAESLADQQANVLQFLVSNPPAWVLDEIINGSTLTTWFPLPIPGMCHFSPFFSFLYTTFAAAILMT